MRPERGERGVGHLLCAGRVRHVNLDGDGLAAGSGDLPGHALGAVGVEVGDHHASAVGSQRLGVGLADALTRTGHDRAGFDCPVQRMRQRAFSSFRPAAAPWPA